jgi:hypothetical protein
MSNNNYKIINGFYVCNNDFKIINDGLNKFREYLVENNLEVEYLDDTVHTLIMQIIRKNNKDGKIDFVTSELMPYRFQLITLYPELDYSEIVDNIPFPCEVVEEEYNLEMQVYRDGNIE